MLDSLHTLEQKGVSSHCVANALVTILQEAIGRRNTGRDFMEKAWPQVWEDVRKVQEELFAEGVVKYTLNRLDLTWFWHGNQEYPCVSTAVKAAQMKDLVPVVARICAQRLREGPKLEQEGPYASLPEKRFWILNSLERFYAICREEGFFLSTAAAEELQECVHKVGTFYQQLTKDAQKLKLKQFSQVPKFHLLEHLAVQGKFLNPKYFSTYMSEDFVGKIAKMGSGLLKGTSRQKVSRKIVKSYRMAWYFYMSKQVPFFNSS